MRFFGLSRLTFRELANRDENTLYAVFGIKPAHKIKITKHVAAEKIYLFSKCLVLWSSHPLRFPPLSVKICLP